jgi:hypothetical protein
MIEYIPLLILVLGGGVLCAAIYQYLRTPSSERYRLPDFQGDRDRLLDAQIESGEVVVIEPQRLKAAVRTLPIILLSLPGLFVIFISKSAENAGYTTVLGMNSAHINLLLISYWLPLMVILLVLSFLPMALKVLRSGYFPPLDSVVFVKTYARKGRISTLRAWLIILAPLFTIYIAYLGHDLYSHMTKGLGYSAFEQKLNNECINKQSKSLN